MAENNENQMPKKLPLPLLAGAVVLIVAATFFFGRTVGASSRKSANAKREPGYRLRLEEMVVNLRGQDRFIKIAPEVEFAKPAKESKPEDFEPFVSRIEGVMTVVFRATPMEGLENEEGIRRVERQMTERINRTLTEPEGKVRNVTLGKFATQ